MNISCHVYYICPLSRSEYEVARASQGTTALAGNPLYSDFEVFGQQRRKGSEKTLNAMVNWRFRAHK